MKEIFTVLIADRNSHIRMFLMREMMAEGYRVKLAGKGEHLLKIAFSEADVDLLVLDPDLPGIDASSLLDIIVERIPALPTILHTSRRYWTENNLISANPLFTVIEKDGDSVERIKTVAEKRLSNVALGVGRKNGLGFQKDATS